MLRDRYVVSGVGKKFIIPASFLNIAVYISLFSRLPLTFSKVNAKKRKSQAISPPSLFPFQSPPLDINHSRGGVWCIQCIFAAHEKKKNVSLLPLKSKRWSWLWEKELQPSFSTCRRSQFYWKWGKTSSFFFKVNVVGCGTTYMWAFFPASWSRGNWTEAPLTEDPRSHVA